MAKSCPTAQYRMPARSLFLSSRGRQTGSSAILAGACAVQYHHMGRTSVSRAPAFRPTVHNLVGRVIKRRVTAGFVPVHACAVKNAAGPGTARQFVTSGLHGACA